MPDDSSGFFRSLSSYANEWIETKRKNLQAKPQTQVDRSGGYSIGFSKQQITQSELREVRRMRESGGLIATAFHIKATIKFGGGVEFQAKDDELEAWLEDTLDGIDNLILDMGEDALWYPYSLGEIVETRTGDFSHIECIEPWTMLPETDEYGDIVRWQQKLQGGQTDIFEPEEIGSVILNKASGRDKTGISEALRNREEIEAFRAYQKSIREVDERIGFPFRHVKAGRDGGAQLNDQQLRRIRNRTNDIGAGETLTTGKDIEIDHENPMEGVDTSNIQERNMRMLATALGLPIELLNEGSDGLGSGMPAELRKELLALQNEADRRRIDDQFTEQFLRPIVKQYSDFDHTQDMGLTIAPFLDKKRDMAELIQSVGEYMTTNEVREKLDMAPVDDEEVGESYRTPEDIETPEEEQDDGFGGLFSEKISQELEARGLTQTRAKHLQEDFDATLFELVATEKQEDFETGARLGIGVEFPNSGVYVDWNIAAWPEEERLDGAHVSEYATIEDAQTVAQGEVRELQAADLSGGADFSDGGREPWEDYMLEMHDRVWSEDGAKQLTGFSESQIPEFVLERLRDVIISGEAVFSDIDGISDNQLMDFRTELARGVTEDGWTIGDITNNIQDLQPELSEHQAEVIARSETSSAVNTARKRGYEETGMLEGERFYWTGGLDNRTTDACSWLIEKTNPNHGGTPVSYERLEELVEEAPAHDDDMQDDLARPENMTVHPQERKTWTRHVE